MNLGVELCRIIRDLKRLNAWDMAKKMSRTIQSYQYLERKSQNLTLQDIICLRDVSELSLDDFWKLLEKEAKRLKKNKKR